jgi:hypothetical protein
LRWLRRMESIATHYAAKRIPSGNDLASSFQAPRTGGKRKASLGPTGALDRDSTRPDDSMDQRVLPAEYADSPRGKRMRADEAGRGIVMPGEGAASELRTGTAVLRTDLNKVKPAAGGRSQPKKTGEPT